MDGMDGGAKGGLEKHNKARRALDGANQNRDPHLEVLAFGREQVDKLSLENLPPHNPP